MNILYFIKTNKLTVIFFALLIAIFNFILITSVHFEKSLNDILYFNFLIAVLSIIYGLYGYRNWLSRYKPLRQSLDSNEDINVTMPDDESFYTLMLKDVIEYKNSEADLQILELKKSIAELNDYITKWVHEIKIPVSVCELILEAIEDNVLVNELQTEIERIKFLTNQVLYISRASSYCEDLCIRDIEIDKVVRNSIKRNSTLLISKNIEISISNLHFTILSDEKWISYSIDQLLHNSYKYLKQDGTIEIGAFLDDNNNVKLSISDNGVGILPKDISRIFDKSFTGNSKFNLSKSTGMGLYITKKMLDKLGHKIEVKSEPNVSTEFIITFNRISDYTFSIASENSKIVLH
ncbi:MAG: sensor histidine kinase [Clostridiaceae bacterium]|nr:sensor histidine kinase [Clostridiaceae bacterium]